MRDMYSGEPRGFGFATFADKAMAKKAKNDLNHTDLSGKPLRISFKRNPSEINHDANLHVSELSPNITGQELEALCSEYGNVLSIIIRTDDKGQSIGYGYVQFEKVEGAEKCIEALNGKEIHGKAIVVKKFVPRTKRANKLMRNNLYLKNFPASFSEEEVAKFIEESFGTFGKINSTCLKQDTKLGRFYAFVAFDKSEDAVSAVSSFSGFDFGGKIPEGEDGLFVDFAQSKIQRRRMLKNKHLKFKNQTNLYIKSIKKDVTSEQLKTIFQKWGTINSVCLKTHNFSGKKAAVTPTSELQFGFVNFPNAEEAKLAFSQAKNDDEVLNLIDLSVKTKDDFIHFAQPANVRKQFLKMKNKNYKATNMMQKSMSMMEKNPIFKQFMMMMKNFNGGGHNSGHHMRNKRFQHKRGHHHGNHHGHGGNNFGNMNMMNMMGNMGNMGNMGGMNMGNMGMNMGGMNMGAMGMNPMGGMGNNMMMNNNFKPQMPNMPPMNNLMSQNPNSMMNQIRPNPNLNTLPNLPSMGINSLNLPSLPTNMNKNLPNLPQIPQNLQNTRNQNQIPQKKDVNWLKNNLDEFNAMSQADKKNILGTLMYSKVNGVAAKNLVPKITGMLIDLDVLGVPEIIEILSDDEILRERIEEATKIIKEDNDGN